MLFYLNDSLLLSVLPLFVAAYLPKTAAKRFCSCYFGVMTILLIGFLCFAGSFALLGQLFTDG
jgi:hypothetical protein